MGDPFNGTLCYGFRLKSEGENIDPQEAPMIEDFEEFVEKLYEFKRKQPSSKAKKSEWHKYSDEHDNFLNSVGVSLEITHCFDYPGNYILAARESSHCGSGLCPTEIAPESLVIKQEWREKLLAFCKKAGIEFREPAWLLTAYGG